MFVVLREDSSVVGRGRDPDFFVITGAGVIGLATWDHLRDQLKGVVAGEWPLSDVYEVLYAKFPRVAEPVRVRVEIQHQSTSGPVPVRLHSVPLGIPVWWGSL